ncbi:MAG: ABC transporter permease subunit [Rhizobiaceae bacterium]
MMIWKQIIRFRWSLFPGALFAAALLGLIGLLLWQLADFSAEKSSWFASLQARDWQIVRFTAFQASLSTILSLVVGVLLAWSLHHQRTFPGRPILIALLSSALVIPTLVLVLGLVTVFGRNGWLNQITNSLFDYNFGSFLYGLMGILIAHVYFNGSFAARSLLNRFETIPPEKFKLCRSLGLTAWQRFILIEWPAIRTTLPGLAVTIFLLCFTSFAIVLILGGSPRYNTLEVTIFEALKLDFDIPRALDLAVLQLIICAALVMLASGFRSNTQKIAIQGSYSQWPEPPRIGGIQKGLIFAFGLVFLLPLGATILDGLQADYAKILSAESFRRAFVTTIAIASGSSLLTVVVALLIAATKRNFTLATRMNSGLFAELAERSLSFSAMLYLAVPSLVLGLGFFLLARQMPGPQNLWAAIALVSANLFMALPFALTVLAPAMEKTGLRYDKLSFSLGLGPLARWRNGEWPLLRSDIGYVCALSFCISMGDLGVIALFGSQDFATLPWYLYQMMGSYRTHDAAGVALIMLILTLSVFLGFPRLFSGLNEVKNAET